MLPSEDTGHDIGKGRLGSERSRDHPENLEGRDVTCSAWSVVENCCCLIVAGARAFLFWPSFVVAGDLVVQKSILDWLPRRLSVLVKFATYFILGNFNQFSEYGNTFRREWLFLKLIRQIMLCWIMPLYLHQQKITILTCMNFNASGTYPQKENQIRINKKDAEPFSLHTFSFITPPYI